MARNWGLPPLPQLGFNLQTALPPNAARLKTAPNEMQPNSSTSQQDGYYNLKSNKSHDMYIASSYISYICCET